MHRYRDVNRQRHSNSPTYLSLRGIEPHQYIYIYMRNRTSSVYIYIHT